MRDSGVTTLLTHCAHHAPGAEPGLRGGLATRPVLVVLGITGNEIVG